MTDCHEIRAIVHAAIDHKMEIIRKLTMRKFETLLLLSPELTSEERENTLAVVTGVIEREGGSILTADHWGMRDLAYPVRKQMRGYYVRYEYNAPPQLIAEMERIIRITDGIYKFITVKLADKSEEAQSVSETAGE